MTIRMMAVALVSTTMACGKIADDSPSSDAGAPEAAIPDVASVVVPPGGKPIDPSTAKVVECVKGNRGGTGGHADPSGAPGLYAWITNMTCPNVDCVKGRPDDPTCFELGKVGACDASSYYVCGPPIVCPEYRDPACPGGAYACNSDDESAVTTTAMFNNTAFCAVEGSKICCR